MYKNTHNRGTIVHLRVEVCNSGVAVFLNVARSSIIQMEQYRATDQFIFSVFFSRQGAMFFFFLQFSFKQRILGVSHTEQNINRSYGVRNSWFSSGAVENRGEKLRSYYYFSFYLCKYETLKNSGDDVGSRVWNFHCFSSLRKIPLQVFYDRLNLVQLINQPCSRVTLSPIYFLEQSPLSDIKNNSHHDV